MRYPQSIQKLIELLTRWPSVGPKTAERFVLSLLNKDQLYLNDLANAITNLKSDLTICSACHSIASASPCHICSDKRRDQSNLCIVAETKDVLAIENTNQYHGLYHVLGGTLNTIKDINPADLNISSLTHKISSNQIKEIILALNPDLEGETTCLYLQRILSASNIRITRLARGLAQGSSIDYADELTLSHALQYRREFKNNQIN